jgi:hypothetical protein
MNIARNFVVGVLALTLLSTCETNKEAGVADVELNFSADFGNDPLVMYANSYAYEDNMDFRLQLFQFYISNGYLINADGTTGPKVLDVALVNFGGVQSESEAEAGVSVVLKDVPAGNYKGLRLGIGVDPVLNQTQPGDYSVDHPLSTNYWLMTNSYVFAKIEGNADFDKAGTYASEVTLHMGGDNNYREKTFEVPFEVKGENLKTLHFSVDVKKALVDGNGKFLNFATTPQIHSDLSPWAVFIADNLQNALQMQDL